MERGPLGLVLKMSRAVGIAPFTYAPEFKISRTLAMYGKFTSVINGVLIISIAAEDFWLTIKDNKAIWATQVIFAIAVIVVAIINMLGAFTAPARMMRLNIYLKKLKQIDKKLNKNFQRNLKNKFNYIILILIGGFFVLFLLDFVVRLKLYATLNWPLKMLNALLTVNLLITTLLQLQITFFAQRVNSTLKSVNDNLQRLIFNDNSDTSAIRNRSLRNENGAPDMSLNFINYRNVRRIAQNDGKSVKTNFRANKIICKPFQVNVSAFIRSTKLANEKSIPRKIREMATMYEFICEIVLKTSEADGAIMMLWIVFVALFLESNIYLAFLLGTSNLPTINILLGVFFPLYFALCWITFIIFFIEQFHQTHYEIERTYNLINSRTSTEDETDVEHELELFYRMLILNNVKYSPFDMFTIDRSLIMKLFSGLITYLVIAIQYGPETQKNDNSNINKTSTF